MIEYLFPKNLIAFGIIWVLIGFFSIWFVGLVTYWRRLRTERKRIENNQNIQQLVNATQERDRRREDKDQKVDPENAFSEFCEENSLNRRSPITKHLKAIFLAGWNESRLEGSELINHTTSELFKWNNLFRSMLAVFIVIGLLGTLFGLADSLSGLSIPLRENEASESTIANTEEGTANQPSEENSKKMTEALRELLDKMEGALAPSIWGIIFTIIGVIFYGIYLQSVCHPLKSTLEQSTLTIWIPQLYPTTSQKLIQTLQQSESQMQKGFETAARFSESAEKVHDHIDGFNESLIQARAITQPLSDSVAEINKAASDISTAAEVLNTGFTENLDKFSQEFSSSVTRLTGFQDEIRNLHGQFQEAANQKLDQQIETLNKQDQNLTTTVEALKNSEKLYVDSCQQIDETLQKFLEKTTEASAHIETTNKQFLEGINTKNREWLAEIQTQLKTDLAIIQPTLKKELKTLSNQLTTDLEGVQGTLDEKLTALTNQLNFFQAPIERAAEQMEGVIESFTSIMKGIVTDLQSEFQEQNERIREQNEKYEAQLTGVRNLNEGVLNLLNQLDESSKNQSTAIGTLNSKVENLTENTQNLAAAITSFTSDSEAVSEYVAAIGRHTATLGNTSQQFVEKMEKTDVTPLNVNIERLNTIIGDISQNSQTLAITVDKLERQMRASETERPDQTQKKRSFFGWINPFSRR